MKTFLAVARRRVIVLLAVAVLAGGTNVAYAHYVYEKAYTYYSTSAPCVENYAEISHGDGYGYAKVNLKSWRKLIWFPLECFYEFERPQNNMKVKYELHYHNGNIWTLCQDSSYKYNSTVTAELEKTRKFTSSEYCGAGNYGVWNTGYAKNNEWYGGSVWAGTHNLN